MVKAIKKSAEGQEKHVFPDLFSHWIITASDNIREFKVRQKRENEVIVYVDLLENDDQCVHALKTGYQGNSRHTGYFSR